MPNNGGSMHRIDGKVSIHCSEAVTALDAWRSVVGLGRQEMAEFVRVSLPTLRKVLDGYGAGSTVIGAIAHRTGLPESIIVDAAKRHDWAFMFKPNGTVGVLDD